MKNVSHWLPTSINCAYRVFSIDEYEESVHCDAALLTLPQSLQNASMERKASFRAGRSCALRALSAAGAEAISTLDRAADGLPQWPSGWTGSISHAIANQTGVAIAVVAPCAHASAIAIDCEPIFAINHAIEIAPLIVNSTEQRLGERLGYGHAEWLTMVYSLKETLYKLLYAHVRSFMPFEAAELMSFDAGTGQACLMLSRDWGDLAAGRRYWLQTRSVSIDAIGDCVLSFALEQA